MYTKAELANRKIFIATKLIISDITYSQDDQYVILRLKRNKIDIKSTYVEIIIAIIENSTCIVAAPQKHFILDP